MSSPDERYDAAHLAKGAANYGALTPLSFLPRAAAVYPDKPAVVHGALRFTYRQFHERCRRLADALRRRGIGPGDTVAVLAPNVPALLEAHYGVPMAGAVLNALNYRLDARSLAFILAHGEAKLLIADREFAPVVKPALAQLGRPLPLVEIDDNSRRRAARRHRVRERFSAKATRRPNGRCPVTNGRRSRSTTPRAPPATRRGSSTTTAARF